MAAGLPVIGSDLSGIPVLIRDGINGILVKERDIDGLARGMAKLDEDRDLRLQFGARSRTIIREYVNYDTVASYISGLYHLIAAAKGAKVQPPPFDLGFSG